MKAWSYQNLIMEANMAGIYGNSDEDRYFEQLTLDYTDAKCPNCGDAYDMCPCEPEDLEE